MKRSTGTTLCLLAVSSVGLIALAGCEQSGPAETAGRQIDRTMDKVGKQVDQAADSAKEQTAKAGQVIDDASITAAVKAGIVAEPGLKVLDIDVDTKNGQVVLTGSVDSAEHIEKAAQVASNVQGVKSVDNRLSVSPNS